MNHLPYSTVRPCPVCLSHDGLLLCQIDYPAEKNRILPIQYRIIGCSQCGMVYDDFDADEQVFARHYQNSGKYELEESGGAGGRSCVDLARWQKIIDRLVPYLENRDVSIIDIGCGKGGMLQCLWETGYHNIMGLDASPGCIQYIREHYSFPAVCCNVSDYKPEHLFDIVLSNQVLEHLFGCREYLESMCRMLSPSGVLYMEMPDASGYLKYGKAPFYFFDQEHINHFQPDSLKNLLIQSKYNIIQINQFRAEPLPNFFTPNICVLATPGNTPQPLLKNDISPVEYYISDSEKRDKALQMIPQIQGTGYLWGVGAFCERLLESGAFKHLNIVGLIDVDPKKQGTEVHGLVIFPPEILRSVKGADYVIITSVLYETNIRKQLLNLGFLGQILVLK